MHVHIGKLQAEGDYGLQTWQNCTIIHNSRLNEDENDTEGRLLNWRLLLRKKC
jgi:hypothetical protein